MILLIIMVMITPRVLDPLSAWFDLFPMFMAPFAFADLNEARAIICPSIEPLKMMSPQWLPVGMDDLCCKRLREGVLESMM